MNRNLMKLFLALQINCIPNTKHSIHTNNSHLAVKIFYRWNCRFCDIRKSGRQCEPTKIVNQTDEQFCFSVRKAIAIAAKRKMNQVKRRSCHW